MPLTKAEIANTIHSQFDLTKNQSTEILETLLEIIKQNLASGEDVMISNFGKFRVLEKGERKGRNPATGEDMMLAARKVVTFRCSKTLKDRVNER